MKLIILTWTFTLIIIMMRADGKTVRISKERQLEKNPSLKYFLDDDEFSIKDDDENDEKPPVIFTGDVTKSKILQQENKNHGKGKFKYSLETQNGIEISQVGKLKDSKTLIVMGSYAYTGADGKRYRVRYTADEFGYHPITSLEVELPDVQPPVPTVSSKLSSFSNNFNFNRKLDTSDYTNGDDGSNPDSKLITNRFGGTDGVEGYGNNNGDGGFAGYDRNANAYGYQGGNGNSRSNNPTSNVNVNSNSRLTQGVGYNGGAGANKQSSSTETFEDDGGFVENGYNGNKRNDGFNVYDRNTASAGRNVPNEPLELVGSYGSTESIPVEINAGNPFRNQGEHELQNVDRKYLPPTDYLPPTEEYLPPNKVLPPFSK